MAPDYQGNRIVAKALLVKCPFDLELDDCPLREVRRLAFGERMALVNDMPDEEITSVIRHHQDCQRKRLLHETPKKRVW